MSMIAEPMKMVSEMRAGLRDIAVASRIFLVVAVLALVAAIGVLAWQQGALTRTIDVSFFAGTADGMNKGMAVKLVGFKVGSVDAISVTPDLRVKVSVKLDEKYRNMIDGDAVVRLAREGLIGGNVLEVRPGSGDKGPIKDKAVLRYEREPALDAAVVALVDQIAPVIADVKQVTTFLASPEGDFRQAIGNANRAAAALVETRADLKKLIASLGEGFDRSEKQLAAVLDTTNGLLQETRASVAVLDGSLRKMDAALPGIATKMDQSLENIRVASEAIRGVATGQLPGLVGDAGTLVGEGSALVSDTNEIVRGAKQTWPVRNLVPPRQELRLRLDSGGGLSAMPPEGKR
ncbi:MAG TPA: MlaD family protein [Burkholderiales bacterium]|nr:MlaD family protein [Burkholderiales bacterium]